MKLKKLILGFALIAFLTVPAMCSAQQVTDATIRNMVAKYKAKNYTGCLQAAQAILKVSPSNAYAFYYEGLSHMQLGNKEDAEASFQKVISLNTNKTLTKYAELGSVCLEDEEKCAAMSNRSDELDNFIKSNKFYDKDVQSEVNKKKLDRIRQNINEELGGKKKSEVPSNEEIANAVKTLAKVGFNPMAGFNGNMYSNPEMMQMNMLLGNNGNGAQMNNMLPFLLMSQNQDGTQKMSPELIQSMMMSQMQMY